MHPELLALMKEFKLCYELEGAKNTFLAPNLFAESQPDYIWDETDNLIVKLKYGFMPKGLIAQFIVRMNDYVKELETAWKHGVILSESESESESKSENSDDQTREVFKTSRVLVNHNNEQNHEQHNGNFQQSGSDYPPFLDNENYRNDAW
jgi:hypothetical protein